jgi:biotin-[acetyl-CoA-carboxylase] ligase BirA-like protein
MMEFVKNFTYSTEIYTYNELPSTQQKAIELLEEEGARDFLVNCTKQTNGIGRSNKSWISTESDICFTSVIQNPNLDAIPIHIACGIQIYLNDLTLQKVQIKWPNDIIINGNKICGILTQQINNRIIFGVGINISSRIKTYYGGKFDPIGIEQITSNKVSISILNSYIMATFEYSKIYGTQPIINYANNNLFLKNQEVTINNTKGTIKHINTIGNLVLQDGATITYGEVS